MAHLAETTVQHIAIEHLRKKYTRFAWRSRIYAQAEARTCKEYGGKRADGLLAFKHWLHGTYVVSIEAKSIKTISSFKPQFDTAKWLQNSLFVGLLLCLASGIFSYLFHHRHTYPQFLLTILTIFAIGLAYGYLSRNSYKHQTAPVLKQLDQYPANEQWLAFSKDSFDKVPTILQKNLRKMCNTKGIGILIIGTNGKVTVLSKARTQRRWWGSYISYYSNHQEIKKYLA